GLVALGEADLDLQLPRLAGLDEGQLGRRDAHLGDLAVALVPDRAVGDPLPEYLVLPGILGEADAALVADLAGGLEEAQTLIRIGGVEAAPERAAGQVQVILVGGVAKERKLKTPLALERAMAGAAVATHAAEQAHDVALEIDLFQFAAGGQLDGG